VSWPEAPITGEIGTPAIPVFREVFLVPPLQTAHIDVRTGVATFIDATTFGARLRLMPVQPPVEKIPGARENAEFMFNEAAYRIDADLLGERAVIKELGIVRGQRLFLLEIRPVDYNPVAEKLTIWPEIEVDVTFSGRPAAPSMRSSLPGLHHIVLNPGLIVPSSRGSGNYLIVTDNTFDAAIAPFASAKEAQGFTVATHSVAPGTSSTTIKSYIEGLWGTADEPEYILLVGDTGQIPHWVGGGTGSPDTDIQY